MELEDFLKIKKVRCVTGSSHNFVTAGKIYEVIGVSHGRIKIHNDEGGNSWYDMDWFELVIEPVENNPPTAELASELEAAEPTFKVGDRVYYGSEHRILTIAEFDDDGWIRPDRWVGFINNKQCCHATQENYEMLCKLYPHIKFERPPLTGSDLARVMLDKGWVSVPCYISDSSDTHALERQTRTVAVITGIDKDHPSFFVYGSGKSFISHAVPFDPRTSEPLTEAVLDE